MAKYIELIDKYRIEQGEGDYNPPSYHWVDNTGYIVRCRECKHWSQTDTINGESYGQCLYPHTVVRSNCFVQESFYCADGEGKAQE